ncbi:MAG: iron-containing alcohol dehydrogenase, partial [Clostridia bacterium]|nr:iron-containing alcohol dehydrogenase [Clostridia bacterium]
PYEHVLLVADSNIFPLAGDRVVSLLKSRIESALVFETGDDLLVPDEASIAAIEEKLTDKTDFILGIGSGVINDLCKYVSFYHGLESGIIATAPSMDGFASSGAAMILAGMKVTKTTHAPWLILGDVELLASAPMDMIRSGYADIIGKYSALCDWRLSECVNGEYLCPYVYDIVMERTNALRASAAAIAERDLHAIEFLMETLVLVGVCLTLLSTTRPGSGSEHHMSHYFEITGLIDGKPYFPHGTDVGYATIVTAEMRERIAAVDAPVFHAISDEDRMAAYETIYKHLAKEVWDLQETAGRYKTSVDDVYRKKWDEIRAILRECPSGDEIRAMLTEVGFDLGAFEALYGKEKIQNGMWFGKDLKDRYSVLWLYAELFLTEEEMKKI